MVMAMGSVRCSETVRSTILVVDAVYALGALGGRRTAAVTRATRIDTLLCPSSMHYMHSVPRACRWPLTRLARTHMTAGCIGSARPRSQCRRDGP
jgi:hypothetical protein